MKLISTPVPQSFRFLLLLFLLIGAFQVVQAQTPGVIFQKAGTTTGQNVLDPNGDGYTSRSTNGFTGGLDMGTYSEIPYRFLPQMPAPSGPEPLADLVTGSNGGHTDLADVPLAMYFKDNAPASTDYSTKYLQFRVRLGGNSTASKGYSFLLDTDGVFNQRKLADGTVIEYATPSKVKNLGFEYEVVLALNFDVIVYRHTGSGDDSDPMSSNVIWRGSANGGYSQYFQKSVAASTAGGNADYFFDFYVPLSAFRADGSAGITPSTKMRISGSTVTSAQTGLEGTISDIGGVNDKLYGNDKIKIWKDVVPNFPPTSPEDIATGDFCSGPPTAPVITTTSITPNVTVTQTSTGSGNNITYTTTTTYAARTISGTSSAANGSTVTLYKNGVAFATTTITNSGASPSWSYTSPSGSTGISFGVNDKITAKVTVSASGNCPASISSASNTVTVTAAATCTTLPTAPVITQIDNKDVAIGTTLYPDATIKFYKDGELQGYTAKSGTTGTTSGGVTTYSWTYDDPAYKFNGFAYPPGGSNGDATRKSYATLNFTVTPNPTPAGGTNPANTSFCESGRSAPYFAQTSTASPSTGTTATPTLDATTCFGTGATFIKGTRAANALIYLYINGVPVTTSGDGSIAPTPFTSTTTTDFTIDITSYTIPTNASVTVRAKQPTTDLTNYPSGYLGLSQSATALTYSANCVTASPIITGTYCPTTRTVTGTSTEAVGTNIIVYTKASNATANTATDVQVATATVVTGGTWSATLKGEVISLTAGAHLYATAQASGKSISLASATVTIGTQSTASSLGLTLNSPITEGATSISGTTKTSGTISLYIGGSKLTETVAVTHSGGTTPTPWTINLGSASKLNVVAGDSVTASITVGSTCESAQTSKVGISCSAPSSSPTTSMAVTSLCAGSKGSITVNNTESGVIYQVYSNGVASGNSVIGTGGTITVQSGELTSSSTLTVRAYKAGTSGCQTTLSGSYVTTILAAPTPQTVTLVTRGCNGTSSTISLGSSEVGVTYQLYTYNETTDTYTAVPHSTTATATTAPTVAGTGSAISLTTPLLSATATYKVVGTYTGGTQCPRDMSNTVTVYVVNKALTFTPTSQATCSTGKASITIASSQLGITYQLFNTTANANSGTAVNGTGGSITLTSDALTTTSNFRVDAYVTSVGSSDACRTPLTQTFSVPVISVATPVISASSSSVCTGASATITINNAQVGVTYQVYNNNLLETRGTAVTATTAGNLTLTFTPTVSGTNSYSVRATTSCGSVLSSAVSITVSSPTVYSITSASSVIVCSGTSATIALSGSQSGATYQLYTFNTSTNTWVAVTNGTTSASATPTVAGTGSAINLVTPFVSAPTLFKVVSSINGCTADMTGTVTVNVPNINMGVSPTATTICASNTVTVTVQSTQIGVSYRLYTTAGNVASGSAVEGTGGDIVLTSGTINSTTTFKVVAIYSTCNRDFTTNFVTVTVDNSTPTVYTATPSTQNVCSNNLAYMNLSGSQEGVSYQLMQSATLNGTYTATGNAVTGTGSAITLYSSALSSSVYLKVVATKTGCGLTADMSGTSQVTVGASPTVVTISPSTQNVCSGYATTISLQSEVGVSYQIYNNTLGASSGLAVAGTGNLITLRSDSLTANATLKVVATRSGCTSVDMTGTSIVTVNAIPTAPAITINNSTICSTTSATVSVTSPTNGLVYKLYRGGTFVSQVTASGGAATFTVSTAGTYTVKVTSSSGCESSASNGVALTVNQTPTDPIITINNASNATVCSGSSATVSVTGATNGVSYQLYLDGAVNGSPVIASNGAATFTVTTAGTYTIKATVSSCTSGFSNGVTLALSPTPLKPSVSASATSVCSGGSVTFTAGNLVSGVTYQLFKDGSAQAGTITYSGSNNVSFTASNITATSSFTIKATGCNTQESDASTVTVSPTPLKPSVSASASSVCGSGSVTFTAGNLVNGVTYQLYKDGVAQAGTTTYTGSNTVSFTATVSAASTKFTIVATSGSCSSVTSDEVTVTTTAAPVAAAISANSTSFCGSGSVTITANSNLVSGLTYQLYRNGVAQAGTITYNGSNTVSFTASVSAASTKFTVVASNGSCTPATSNEVTVTTTSVTAPSLSVDNGIICQGSSTTLAVTSPTNGYDYKLYKDNVYTGTSVTATNGAASFTISSAGSYTVTTNSGNCESSASATATFTVKSAPTAYAMTSPTTQNVCKGSKAIISIASSEVGVIYRLINTATGAASGDEVEGNGSSIYLITDAIEVNGNYTFKATGYSNGCSFATDMGGTATIVVADCPITYDVEPPYLKTSYTYKEVIATPDLTGWTYTGPLTFTILEGTPLTGTALDPTSGKMYISTTDMNTLSSGTRTLQVQATDKNGVSRMTYMTYSINDAIDSDGYERSGPVVVLPVKMLTFSASPTGNGVQLKWTTASELNNDYFQVERSADGKTFTAIGKVQGSGTTTTKQHYTFLDSNSGAGNFYYRLKQVDYDGKFEYSKLVSTKANTAVGTNGLQVLPNPIVSRSFTVNVVSEQERVVTIELRNLQNRAIYRKTVTLSAGTNQLEQELTSPVAAGIYMISVAGNGMNLVQKVVVIQ